MRGPGLPSRRKACVRQAALQLGADEATARIFGETGEAKVGPFTLRVAPLSHQENGPWAAIATMARPEHVPAETWTDALLVANGQSMLSSDWGLWHGRQRRCRAGAPPGDAAGNEQLLAAQLGGLLAMCQATREGVLALGAASPRKGGVQ